MDLFNPTPSASPRKVYYILEAFSKDYLDELAELTKSVSKPFLNTGRSTQIPKGAKERKCWDIPKTDSVKLWIDEVAKIVNDANKFYAFDLFQMLDVMYFEYSSEDQTPLDWHIDLANHWPQNVRKISFSILLSEPFEYEGGDLEINYVPNKLVIPKVKGSMVCFPSFLPHRVTPITKGVRKVIVGWAGGRPFR